MKEFNFDCTNISDKAELHKALAEGLDFPDWYGNNLDALYDCLTGVCEETRIVLRGFAALEESLGSYARSVRRVLLKADADNDYLHVSIE